jgi:hypothetical protein
MMEATATIIEVSIVSFVVFVDQRADTGVGMFLRNAPTGDRNFVGAMPRYRPCFGTDRSPLPTVVILVGFAK